MRCVWGNRTFVPSRSKIRIKCAKVYSSVPLLNGRCVPFYFYTLIIETTGLEIELWTASVFFLIIMREYVTVEWKLGLFLTQMRGSYGKLNAMYIPLRYPTSIHVFPSPGIIRNFHGSYGHLHAERGSKVRWVSGFCFLDDVIDHQFHRCGLWKVSLRTFEGD